jgi:hypothetical protein
MSLYLAPNEDVVPTPGQPKVKEVRAYVSQSTEYGASDVHDTPDTHWIMGLPDAEGGWDHESDVTFSKVFRLTGFVGCGQGADGDRRD